MAEKCSLIFVVCCILLWPKDDGMDRGWLANPAMSRICLCHLAGSDSCGRVGTTHDCQNEKPAVESS